MPNSNNSIALIGTALVLLVASASVNVLQAQRIRELTNPTPRASSIGKRAIPLSGYTVAGSPAVIPAQNATPVVLYFFSPTCSWCEKNWKNVEALADRGEGRYRVVAVAAERGLRGFVAERGLRTDVMEGLSEDVRKYFGFSGTPHTLVVSADGLITQEWRGAYTPRIHRQIEGLFDIALPGLTLASAARAGAR